MENFLHKTTLRNVTWKWLAVPKIAAWGIMAERQYQEKLKIAKGEHWMLSQ